MSSFDDYPFEEEFLGRAMDEGGELADGIELDEFVAGLRRLGDAPAPPPSRELAAALSGVAVLDRVERRDRAVHRRLHRPVATRRHLLVAAAAALVLTLASSQIRDRLPQPAQRFVSDVVQLLTPFDGASNQQTAPAVRPAPGVPARGHRTAPPAHTTVPSGPGSVPAVPPDERGEDPTGSEPRQSSDPREPAESPTADPVEAGDPAPSPVPSTQPQQAEEDWTAQSTPTASTSTTRESSQYQESATDR